jgi:hypothetical protein
MNTVRTGSIFIVLLLFVVAANAAPVINPVVTNKPFWCKFVLTKWVCGPAGAQGPQGPPGITGNATNYSILYNATFNSTAFITDISNLYGTIVNGNLTLNASVINFYNITVSEMNQTANMTAGPQGIQGIQGIQGPTGPANMTAGPTGPAGTPGAPGTAATVNVNNTFTDYGGTNAMVTNVGDPLNANLDFIIPVPLPTANLSQMYPVGIVIMSAIPGDNPNTTIGFGNWTLIKVG